MEQVTLYDEIKTLPLAARMRPDNLEDFAGQQHLLGPDKVLRRLIERDQITSLILWGPPGVGKTTLAHIIATQTHSKFIAYSAVTSGVKELRSVMEQAETNRRFGERTILFVDEIHRFNRAQQDAFLPYVEKGSIILIGATTENPSFEVNSALLSRCKVFVLKPLTVEDLTWLLQRALKDSKGYGGQKIEIEPELVKAIAEFSNGDARTALSTLEMVILNGETTADTVTVTHQTVQQATSRKLLLYDKKGEEHYNLISALHKSMRNSDPDAALYWLARMLESGEDPLYVARRVLRFASEDVGLADSTALPLAVAAFQACHILGMPECNDALAEAVVYLSLAPKSNAVYAGYEEAKRDALETESEPVPLAIRNAPTQLMKQLDYGKGYQYAHNRPEKITSLCCFPESLRDRSYYKPTDQGQEVRWAQRLEWIKQWKQRHRDDDPVGGCPYHN